MSEQLEEAKSEDSKPQMTIGDRLKRVALAIIFLVIVTQMLGRQFPNLMPSKISEKAPEKIVEKTIEKPEAPIEEKREPAIPVVVAPVVPSSQNDEKIKALEEKIASLEAANKSTISELEARITTENSTTQSKTESIVFALVTLGQLKEAVKNGEAYSEQLSSLKSLATNKPEAEEIITMLESHSADGIKTPAQLKIELSPLIKQILANKSENVFLQTLHKFITIRKVGEQKGDDDESILARTEAKLTQGDLSAALQETQKLLPPAQEILASWVENVKLWLSTQKNIDKLQLLLAKTEPVLKP